MGSRKMQSDNKSMKGIYTNDITFDQRMQALKFIAQQAPNRVSCADLSKILVGSTRTHQRILKGLVMLGYLITDDCNPKGYWINKEQFKDFENL